MMAKETTFGTLPDGQTVVQYTLRNKNGLEADILTYGGILRTLHVPSQSGKKADVVNGFDTLEEYMEKSRYFGALVGRFANRIALGKFTLEGEEYSLAVNNGPNALHGGLKGFDKRVWKTESASEDSVTLTYTSADGEEGYPGEMQVKVTYQITEENELKISYTATSTKSTIINLTNHSYFNLGGHESGTIHDHKVMINADMFTPKDETSIPTGEIAKVDKSAFDLRSPVRLGDVMDKVPDGPGFDHNFCINGEPGEKFAARVEHPGSGRVMEVYTTQPGVQFYTANFLQGQKGKADAEYAKQTSLCLETQNYPDAINKKNFPSCVLKPNEVYQHSTKYKFSWN